MTTLIALAAVTIAVLGVTVIYANNAGGVPMMEGSAPLGIVQMMQRATSLPVEQFDAI
jgi:hypothetical protein